MNKIAFCFIIKDKLYNQPFWKKYLQNTDVESYEIYIHYKTKPEIILDKYKLVDSIETRWADISLVKASDILFKEASNDNCNVFFLLSGDTLPLVKFQELSNIDKSIFSVQPVYFGAQHRYKNYNQVSHNIKRIIPYCKWLKQNMFFCITKYDYEKISSVPFFQDFQYLEVPDEYYYINLAIYYNIDFIYGKYIFVDINQVRTQAMQYQIPNYFFKEYGDIILKYLFCRKIFEFSELDFYLEWYHNDEQDNNTQTPYLTSR